MGFAKWNALVHICCVVMAVDIFVTCERTIVSKDDIDLEDAGRGESEKAGGRIEVEGGDGLAGGAR